ncbi:AAA-ATPase ASD, mitochondrial-like [Argentina anserina]|uniref:AAA-ATPase ASD, mitochondrial-like n=1 Tax=Argentina anserina TaxID=57926 RepID=UPI0021762A06|nr:AAA-ATPase ASD, mitochondrial-like [Potentilla anserina]
MMKMGEMWPQLGSVIASVMFGYAMVMQIFPYQLRTPIKIYANKMFGYVYPYIQISFDEYTGEWHKKSELFATIQSYLSTKSSTEAKRLKAQDVKDSKSLVLAMDDNEEVTDEFQGIKLWWASSKNPPTKSSFSFYPQSDDKRQYKLTFHRRHRDIIMGSYLDHVRKQGKAIAVSNRQRKLFINNPASNWSGYKATKWSPVVFEHPATFETIAMEPKKKEDIVNDLIKFSKGKEYYAKVGKAWKRGYLLYGPPGTGKSTMIAAMSNLMDYDVYDLELTAVKNNTELRKLLIDTPNKAIIVIEDIDCSLDLTGQRKKKKEKDDDEDKENDPIKKMIRGEESKPSEVTLSGLLNFIDGIWSACGGERIIVFTTNYVDKLDPALIRRGRMDKHIELSYCCYEAFKVLARNYLDLESHELFGTIERLLGETNMTPADVAENLMPKSDIEDADSCLKSLIEALENAKEEARVKAEEDAKLKAEEEEKLKAEKEEKLKEEEAKLKPEKEEKEKVESGKEVKCKLCNGTSAKQDGKDNGVSH